MKNLKRIKIHYLVTKLCVIALFALWFTVGLLSPAHSISTTPSLPPSTPSQVPDLGEKIKEQIKSSVEEPAAYTGVVTDKTDASLTLSTKSGPKQVSLDKSVKVIKQKDSTRANVKVEDIAINDYVLAMGYLNPGNGKVLAAKRIIIAPKPEAKSPIALSGSIIQIATSSIKLETKNRAEWDITLDKNSEIKILQGTKFVSAKTTDLDLNLKVIVLAQKLSEKKAAGKFIGILNPSPTP